MRTILTFARGWNALAAARSLGRRGVQIIAGDEYRVLAHQLFALHDREFSLPDPDEDPRRVSR